MAAELMEEKKPRKYIRGWSAMSQCIGVAMRKQIDT